MYNVPIRRQIPAINDVVFISRWSPFYHTFLSNCSYIYIDFKNSLGKKHFIYKYINSFWPHHAVRISTSGVIHFYTFDGVLYWVSRCAVNFHSRFQQKKRGFKKNYMHKNWLTILTQPCSEISYSGRLEIWNLKNTFLLYLKLKKGQFVENGMYHF